MELTDFQKVGPNSYDIFRQLKLKKIVKVSNRVDALLLLLPKIILLSNCQKNGNLKDEK